MAWRPRFTAPSASTTDSSTPDGTDENAPGILATGRHAGIVGVAICLAEADPGADLEGFEDVVEIDFVALDSVLAVEEWEPDNVTYIGELPTEPSPPVVLRISSSLAKTAQ